MLDTPGRGVYCRVTKRVGENMMSTTSDSKRIAATFDGRNIRSLTRADQRVASVLVCGGFLSHNGRGDLVAIDR